MSTNLQPLLIELFTEELPPKALKKLGAAFAEGIAASLRADGLLVEEATVESFATPRRLGVRLSAVRDTAPARAVREKLMPLSVARDAEGRASVALRKKLAAQGREALADDFPNARQGSEALLIESDGKAEYVYRVGEAPGKTLAAGVQTALDQGIGKLPIPKVMTYQLADGLTDVNFVRPAHGLIVLHGETLIEATALGLQSGRIAHGHRFQGAANIEIDRADRYEALLREYGKVEPSYAARRALILQQLQAAADQLGATLGPAAEYDALLDEVNALVEWPTVYVCQFEPEFLTVPQECLILTMKTNQKYFPLFDAAGKLRHQFLIVSNMAPAQPARIIEGNERVVRPRLADARFFFETDQKTPLIDRVPALDRVVYHNKLGTQGERVQRIVQLAGELAALIGVDRAQAERAATLAKADLVTQMVGEFPELQGTMGRYYALNDGEPVAVADAIEDHYKPRFAGDSLPRGEVGVVVALADKLETLVGLFGIGQLPTGDKDPFALRRHALGVLRMLVERALPLDLPTALARAAATFGSKLTDAEASNAQLLQFIYERLSGYLREGGYSAQEVDAVVAVRPAWGDFPRRLEAARAFAALPEAPALAAANKRVANILSKAAEAGETLGAVDAAVAQEPAEQALHQALQTIAPKADGLFAAGDYTGYLQSFAQLKAPVDAFFEQVMVMAEDRSVRANRLALLRDLQQAMNKVADLSRLAV